MTQAEEQSIDRTKERNFGLAISRIDSEDRAGIGDYYQHEINQGFADSEKDEAAFKRRIDFRQSQIRTGKLKVAMAKDGGKLMATSVVVLENGTMGKNIKPDEAWAAGTVVLKGHQGQHIGSQMSAEQDAIAREAGKRFMVTKIASDNFPSMRLRMNVGYCLEGVEHNVHETDYLYRKDLQQPENFNHEWTKAVREGNLAAFEGGLSDSSPNQILIDPADIEHVRMATVANYRGVFLLRPEDFGKAAGQDKPISRNMIVFKREKAS